MISLIKVIRITFEQLTSNFENQNIGISGICFFVIQNSSYVVVSLIVLLQRVFHR